MIGSKKEFVNGQVVESPSPAMVFQTLQEIAVAQQEETRIRRQVTAPFDKHADLYATYMASKAFQDTWSEALKWCLSPKGLNMSYFSGRMFQDIAERYFEARLPREQLLVYPKGVRELWGILYPNAEESFQPFGQSSLLGRSDPDGLILISNAQGFKIQGFLESTLTGKPGKVEKKLQVLEAVEIGFPYLFAENPYCQFVVPKGGILNRRLIERAGVVHFLEVPIFPSRFRKFGEDVYENYRRSDEAASLAEARARVTLQKDRAGQKLRDMVTPENLAYFLRFGEVSS